MSWRRVAIGLAVGLPIMAVLLYTLGSSHPKVVPIVLIIFGVVGAVVVQNIENRKAKQRVMALFSGRQELDDDAFGSVFFPKETAYCAVRLRELFQKYYPLPLARLHPSDTFVNDLQLDNFDSAALTDYIDDIEKEFQIKILIEDSNNILTFGQLVEYVKSKKAKTVEHMPPGGRGEAPRP